MDFKLFDEVIVTDSDIVGNIVYIKENICTLVIKKNNYCYMQDFDASDLVISNNQ